MITKSRAFGNINNTYLVLLLIGVLSLSLKLSLLDKKWVNPDEGAHLMDAALVLDGKVPLVDFDSRQPFYVYVHAFFFALFGPEFFVGRLCVMIFSLLTGVMVFLLGKELFNERVALLATAFFLFMPLEVFYSVVVKTEPLTMFLTCSSRSRECTVGDLTCTFHS